MRHGNFVGGCFFLFFFFAVSAIILVKINNNRKFYLYGQYSSTIEFTLSDTESSQGAYYI